MGIRAHGFKCPKCGNATKVANSHYETAQYQHSRRICKNPECSMVFTTSTAFIKVIHQSRLSQVQARAA